MGCAEEYKPEGRDVERAVDLVVAHDQIVGVQKSPLDEDAAQAVADPDDGVLERALASAEEGEAGHEGLGVVVYEVVARAPIDPPGVDVGVVTVHEDVGLKTLREPGRRSSGQNMPLLAVHVFSGLPLSPWTRTMSTSAFGWVYTAVVSYRDIVRFSMPWLMRWLEDEVTWAQ